MFKSKRQFKMVALHVIAFLCLIILDFYSVTAKGKGGNNNKNKAPSNDENNPADDLSDKSHKSHLPQHSFGKFISEHPTSVFFITVIIQIAVGMGFSYWFKHHYIHNPKRALNKVIID